MTRTIAVIGGGAAGTMAAIHAAGSNADVLLLERTADGGRKILISGGGRCNVLPGTLDEQRFVTASSVNTMRKMLRNWPHHEQREFFERDLKLPLVLEPESGKLFPVANRARVVRDALIEAAGSRGVEFRPRTLVRQLVRRDAGWRILINGQDPLDVDAVIITTGGLSVPATGSDGFGLQQLRELGHTIHTTYPALTPITDAAHVWDDLAGISLEAQLTATSLTEERSSRGGFLFTHRGYSGPAVLDVSHVLVRAALAGDRTATLHVSVGAESAAHWEAQLASSAQTLIAAIRKTLPARLAERLLIAADVRGDQPLSQLTRDNRRRVIDVLTRLPLPWTGDEGYQKAEVTGGGVSLAEVHPVTFESRLHPGLFIAGEVLDAFGPIGGYNFAWAWATGRGAGLGARRAATS